MSESALYGSSHCALLCTFSCCVLHEAAERVWRRLLQRKGCLYVKLLFLLHNINLYVLIIQVFPFKVSHLGMCKHIKKLCPFLISSLPPPRFSVHICCLNELTRRIATIQLSHEQHFFIQTWIRFKIPSWAIIPTVWASIHVFVATFAYSFATWADLPQLCCH